MSDSAQFICEECGEPATGKTIDGDAICLDCAIETYGDLESLLDIGLSSFSAG